MGFPHTLRIAVVGTSNGIIHDGYLSALRQAPTFVYTRNLSLGASPSTFVPYRLLRADLLAFDVALLESAVNDAACIRAGTFSLAQMCKALEFAVGYLAKSDICPVILIIPPRTRDAHTDAVVKRQVALFSGLGVVGLNGYEAIMGASEASGLPYDAFFRDAAHLKSPIAKRLVARFLSRLEGPVQVPSSVDSKIRYRFQQASPDAPIKWHGNVTPAHRHFKGFLLEEELYSIPDESRLVLTLNDGETLAGIALNMRATSTFAVFEGQDRLIKDMRYDRDGADTKILVCSFRQPIAPRSSQIEMLFVREYKGPSEPSYQVKSSGEAVGGAEIAGFLLQTGSEMPPPRGTDTSTSLIWGGDRSLYLELGELVRETLPESDPATGET